MKHTKLIFTFLLFTFLSTNLFAQYEQWVSRYNGPANGSDGAISIAVDDSGNVYVTGNSAGNGTGTDCVTIKYNSAGVQQWVQRYNGPGNSSDVALSIGVDNLGNVYVAGNSVGSGTGWDYLAIKYNSVGVQQWVQRYNGPANRDDKALSAAIDEMGNVHLTGHSKNSDNWTSYYLTIKYNSAGVQQWVRSLVAAPWLFCTARSIALDNSGNVYVTGETGNDDTGAVWSDWLTIKYNSGGVMLWYIIQDGPYSVNSHDKAYSIGVDNSGRVYVSGTCVEYEYPYNNYIITLVYNSGGGGTYVYEFDKFFSSFAADNLGNMYADGSGAVAKLKPLFPGILWIKHYGSSGSGNSIALDSSNNVYVTGASSGDYATLKYNSSGVQQWVHGYNGPGNGSDAASSIVVDNLGNVYVTGSSAGSGTGSDYATIKYSPTPLPLNAFNLQFPSTGDTITSFPNSTTPVTFSWDISAWGASYKFIFGTSLPVRLITLPIGVNTLSLTMTLGELDNILAGLGVTPGNKLLGAWDVWAFRTYSPQNDSLKAANGPRAITFKRGIPALTVFNLSSPPNGTQINTSPYNDTLLHMKWTHSGDWTTYKWKFGSPTIANPMLIFESNNSGCDTVFSIRNSGLDSVLASLGVQPNEVKVGEWAVWAYNGVDSLKSTQTWSMTLRRANLIVLFYDPFSTGTSKWTITNDGGACVWQIFPAPYPNAYALPPTSVSPVFSADNDHCGVATITTATVNNNINCTGYENISLEFDNDWNDFHLTPNNFAIVEVSYNGGTTWNPIIAWGGGMDVRNTHEYKPLPNASNIPNLKVRFRTAQLYLLGGINTWWVIDNITIRGDLLTGVAKNESQIPKTYALSQNFPNPYNNSTKIKFDIPKASYVKLIVYDVLGREIKTLVNEKLNVGRYETVWDGSSYSSGVYFYRLIADEFINVKKMVLLK